MLMLSFSAKIDIKKGNEKQCVDRNLKFDDKSYVIAQNKWIQMYLIRF